MEFRFAVRRTVFEIQGKKKEHGKRFYSLIAYTFESQIELRFALRRTVSEIQGKTYLDMDIWTNVTK